MFSALAATIGSMTKLKSPTRTISNRGPRPRFTGSFPCVKPMHPAPFGRVASLPFDSMGSLYGGLWLEWRNDIAKVGFEVEVDQHEEDGDLPAMRAISDYHVVASTGELGRVEIKFSIESLAADERTRLASLAEHAKRKGISFELMDRVRLEQNGFIQTVLLLRPYAHMQWAPAAAKLALRRLHGYPPGTLGAWRSRARQHKVPVALAYQLLYRQQLALVYQKLVPADLALCHA
jgi:hypothetical protein